MDHRTRRRKAERNEPPKSRIGMLSMIAAMTAFSNSGYTARTMSHSTRSGKTCICGNRFNHRGRFCSPGCYYAYKKDTAENRDQTHRTQKYRTLMKKWKRHVLRFPSLATKLQILTVAKYSI